MGDDLLAKLEAHVYDADRDDSMTPSQHAAALAMAKTIADEFAAVRLAIWQLQQRPSCQHGPAA